MNSFVPNLVWLPAQVAKLTDREGGIVQSTLQSMAWSIYREAPVAPHLEELVERAWGMIHEPKPVTITDNLLNWFDVTDAFFRIRSDRLNAVIDALDLLAEGKPLSHKVISTRYTQGLPTVSPELGLLSFISLSSSDLRSIAWIIGDVVSRGHA